MRLLEATLLLAAAWPLGSAFGDDGDKSQPPQGAASLAKPDQWGTEKYGYQTQLIPVTSEFVLGKPMLFSLVIKNTGVKPKEYDSQGIHHGCLRILGPDGKVAPYKAGCGQTMGHVRPIDPGEVVSLFQDRDITQEYVIDGPGTYTIQFVEGCYGMSAERDRFPASNVLTLKVLPGARNGQDALIMAIGKALPQGWTVEAFEMSGKPPGKGLGVTLVRHPVSGLKKDVIRVGLWKTEAVAEDSKVYEHLGRSGRQHVYGLIPAEAQKEWPTIRQDLRKALDLEE